MMLTRLALPLLVTMPWPPRVLRQFQKVPISPSEADFHGPYNRLLYTLFPPDTDFTVVPRYLRNNSREPADFLFMLEVFLVDKPVFILEIKSPEVLRYASLREAADRQVRSRIRDLYGVLYSMCLRLMCRLRSVL